MRPQAPAPDGPPVPAGGGPGRWRGLAGRAFVAVLGAGFALAIVAALDFARFASSLQTRAEVGTADGIVALTGGAERIAQAVDLLAAGHGRRLLITGVNPATSGQALAAQAPATARLLACCVDLDRNALNTVGNALEAARWARENRFRSLIVVTASYHMPRSLLELRRVLPDVDLIAYPVVPPGFALDRWWQDGATMRLLLGEYVKYAGAAVGLRFERPTLRTIAPGDAQAQL